MTKKAPTIDEVVSLLDRRSESEVGGNEIQLQKKYGLENLVSVYAEAFPRIKNWAGRMHIMFWLPRYARSNPEVVEVARKGLNDRSRIVRSYCCEALAYSLDRTSIPYLEGLFDHSDETTRADVRAAVTAINEQNHHRYVDREGAGKSFWILNDGDDPRGIH